MADINERLMNGAGLAEMWSLIGNKYNGVYEHWWRRRSSVTGMVEDTTTLSELIVSTLAAGKKNTFYADSYTKGSVYTLTNAKNWVNTGTYPDIVVATLDDLKGKYVVFDGSDSSATMYYIPADATVDAASSTTRATFYGSIIKYQLTEVTDTGTWSYISSESRNTYPDIGVSGNWEYMYLGVPFENARDGAKIQTGSYTGTGTYDSANPCSVALDIVPKLFMIHSPSAKTALIIFAEGLTPTMTSCAPLYTASSTNMRPDIGQYAAVNGTTISWYGSSAAYQLNAAGTAYNWYAIG